MSAVDAIEMNLVTHRERMSVWEQPGWNGTPDRLLAARAAAVAAGSVFIALGLRRRSAAGLSMTGLGASLVAWAIAGRGDFAPARRWTNRLRARLDRESDDRVHEESLQSFPASDAPSSTPTVGSSVRRRRPVR
jgi:hypothetical protein